MKTPQINSWHYYQTHSKPEKLVLMLHGCGGNSDDILSFAPMIEKYAKTGFIAVAPNGFLKSAESDQGFQWFDIENNYLPKLFNTDYSALSKAEKRFFNNMLTGDFGLKAASKTLNAFLDFCQDKFSISNKNSLILGYSQGAMTALDMGLSRSEPVGQIVSVSGCLLPPDSNIQINPTDSKLTLIHGTADTVIGIHSALATQEICRQNGICVRLIRQNGLSHGRGDEAPVFWNKAAYEVAAILNEKSRSAVLNRFINKGIDR